ncbi:MULTISPECIES: hypothetical protein [Shewanella]|uniref:Uncharacterized protein n=2 Tax=Shewanella TaxID=22 RepID=A0A975AJU6_9GAMM|nr:MULTISPECIES: hypothetical protein [Shewanella]QSX28682.1 hypothetical protein JYB88_10315 [Shewanella cyperi]QSX38647.1 hypothetical protein JYB85_07500 [Shewanella sedimentimangrovi]QSX39426.1 hypothetical protein JYB84_10215 [Shewanella cyperi]
MSYKADGHDIKVAFPVDAISVNKNSIAYTDGKGKNRQTFARRSEAQNFVKWLLSSNR